MLFYVFQLVDTMASADSTVELATASCGKRPIQDLTVLETDEQVSPAQKRFVIDVLVGLLLYSTT